jgi:hypothetical protein
MMAALKVLQPNRQAGLDPKIRVLSSDHIFPPRVALPPYGAVRQRGVPPGVPARKTGRTTYIRQPACENASDGARNSPAFAPPPAYESAERAKAIFEGLPGIVAGGIVVWLAGRWVWRKISASESAPA